jgi:photosystem II stability/assembly factor-like uncharacterized protein
MKSISCTISLIICFFITDILYSQPFDEKYYESIEWRNVGPFRGGRSCAVTGVPGKPNLFYFGATGGGIWKTQDGGRSWENISDGYFGGSIGSISVSESDHNVIYVGGGEKTVRGNVSFGYGIWKSEDAGKTWESKGLEKSRHIPRIKIHPKNPDIVYAAVLGNLFAPNPERGIYKSNDGGNTWKKVLYVSDMAGAVDLIIDPNNPRILFASTWKISRSPFNLSSGGEGSALWKSTDSGETWENISENEGLPKGVWGISGVTVSPVNSERVWAIIENEKGGVYRSDDGGKKWKKLNSNRNLRQRAWYYTRIYADTKDEDVVYVVNVSYHKSKDGGKTFSSYRAPHGDHHDLWIAPENSDRMIIGDDGGAQVTYDGGDTWSTYHNQPTSQFYRVTTDNHFPYRIYAAQQDNSTIRIAHRTTGRSITEDDWESTAGGESAHIAIDPQNNDIVYGGSYDGFLTRYNHATGEIQAINVWPDNPMGHGAEGMKYRFQWNFPIVFSKHDPNKLYTFSNHVHLSSDQGRSWELKSPDLTRNDSTKLGSSGGPITKDNTSVEYYCTIFAVDESPLKEGLMWVGSDDGLIHLTRDGGTDWENVTPKNMPEWMMINCIEASPFDEGTCYIVGTKYKAGDFKPYLYKTTDYGKTWKNITKGIEAEHFTRALRADPKRKGLLYAGTETGMYISFDDGENWNSFQMNLPIVPITDLAIKNDNLIASTQGRGLWMIDDLTVLHQMDASIEEKEIHLFKPMPSYRIGGGQSQNNTSSGTNHPSGVMCHYYIDKVNKKDTIALVIKDGLGNEIKRFSTKDKENKLTVEEGANRFVWNMLYTNAKKFEGMIFWWGSLAGPRALPGSYTVELHKNGTIISEGFEIIKDPRSSATDQDLKAQFDFINDVNNKVTEAHEAIETIRDIKSQLSNYKKYIDQDEEIINSINEIDSLVSGVEKELYQTKNKSGQDPLNFPIRLTNKLAHLNSLARMGDFPPTNQAIEVKGELVSLIDEQLQKLKGIIENQVVAFNGLIRQKEVDAIIIKSKE